MGAPFKSRASTLVLLVADLLHPLDRLAVERLLDGDVRHPRRRSRAVPVPLFRRAPDHVARTYLDLRPALALHPPAPLCDNERLPERVPVPGRARARLERD